MRIQFCRMISEFILEIFFMSFINCAASSTDDCILFIEKTLNVENGFQIYVKSIVDSPNEAILYSHSMYQDIMYV